jgi:hypothetical protein
MTSPAKCDWVRFQRVEPSDSVYHLKPEVCRQTQAKGNDGSKQSSPRVEQPNGIITKQSAAEVCCHRSRR